jgi:predicted HicB family RNase H-like nuclease
MTGSTATESMNLRVTPDLKRQVRNYATDNGLSVNAAVAELLAYALAEEAVAARAREDTRRSRTA